MQHVLIIHEVADYPAWKKVFDGAAGIRKDAGERSYQVLKYENEPNKIVHFSAWTSIADARAFFESPWLVQIRKDAGVKAPDFIYLEQLESGRFETRKAALAWAESLTLISLTHAADAEHEAVRSGNTSPKGTRSGSRDRWWKVSHPNVWW